ncbi:unnamed protein product, partial [Caenorhabditis auriculariae]
SLLAHVPAAQASATPHPPVVNSASGDQRGLDALSDRELWAAVARASSSTTFLEKSFRAVLEKLADSKTPQQEIDDSILVNKFRTGRSAYKLLSLWRSWELEREINEDLKRGYYVIEALILCTLTLGLGFIRGQATSRMELTRKPGRIVHFLTRVDASVWDSDNRVSDLTEKNKTTSSARSDGRIKNKKEEIWQKIQYRIALLWFFFFQLINLILLFVFFSASWLETPPFKGVSF